MRENRKTVCKAGKGYGRVERCKKSNNSWQMYRAKEEGGSRRWDRLTGNGQWCKKAKRMDIVSYERTGEEDRWGSKD